MAFPCSTATFGEMFHAVCFLAATTTFPVNNISRQQHFPARTVGQPIPRGNCHLRATATSVTLLPQCNRRGLLFDQLVAAKTDAEQQVVL